MRKAQVREDLGLSVWVVSAAGRSHRTATVAVLRTCTFVQVVDAEPELEDV